MAFMHDRELGFPRNSFWILVVLALPALGEESQAVPMALAIVLGVLWQLVYRRDLAHRLAVLSVWSAFGVVLALVFGLIQQAQMSAGDDATDPRLLQLWLVVVGLVLCELGWRVADDRRAVRRSRAAARETVAARP